MTFSSLLRLLVSSNALFLFSQYAFDAFNDNLEAIFSASFAAAGLWLSFKYIINNKLAKLNLSKAKGYYVRSWSSIFKSYLFVQGKEKSTIYKWRWPRNNEELIQEFPNNAVKISNYLFFNVIKAGGRKYILL